MQKLSRSKIDLFHECQRCFWLEVKHGVKRPPGFPYTINSAIDWLLKQEFDEYRALGRAHPIMEAAGIGAVPYEHPKINEWRHNFTGIRFEHKPTDFLVFGAVDDIWVNPAGELIIVDYKSTGSVQHKIYDEYRRQLEVYQWLFRQNGFTVSETGYFVFARVSKAHGFSAHADAGPAEGEAHERALLPFDIFVEPLTGNPSWVEGALADAHRVLDSDTPPAPGGDCEHCKYRRAANEHAAGKMSHPASS
ncbi:MAG: PD-(D/E)XK nuclease family protein [Candidatus Liptonbacteria bacterium]|nr:PD-(D/E)XK nuclease family protein [Candidatus Liptonbacteria bacterium]